MDLSVLGCALNVTKAKISYDIDGTNLEGFYAIEFNNPSEGTGISCEKFNVNLPYVTRATLTNEDSKSTVFDIFPQEDPTALVPEGKASFVIKGKTIPAGNHSFCIYFKRKVDEKGEHIVCQFKKSRSAPLLVKINLNNATLDPDLPVDTSGEWVPVRGNLVHIIIMKNDSNPSDSDNTTVTEESPQDDQNDTPATNPDPTPTPDPAPATETATPEETPEEPVATTPDVTETPAEPTESKVDERPSEEKSVTEETNEAQKSEEVQETTPEIESVTESEKVVAQTESVNEPDQEREVDSGSAAANDVAGSEEQPGSEVAETSSEEDEEEEDEGEDEEESEDDEEGADADAKKSHTYSAEDLLQFRKHPDCAKEPESLVNSDIPILIKNAKKLGGNQQHKKGKGRGPKKPRRQGKGRGGKGPQVQLKEVKPLEKSENRWKPSALIQVELTAEEKALKTANSILNKLAMENFEPLSAQLVECLTEDSKGDEVLKGIITLIYDKALEQPKFVVLYARLCAVVRRNEKDNSFMQLLAQKAKTEFLTITKANIGEKADYSEEERNYLIKLRYLGNIQFICELYKLKLLNNTVPLRCADGLLKQSNDFISEEDSIEALCKMLKALGARLKHSNAQTLNTIMMQLNEKKESMSSRIRFMIQDIVELHKHNWEKPQAKRTPLRHSKSKITSSSPNVPTSPSPKDTWNTVGKSRTKGTSKGGNGPRGTPIRSSWGSVNTAPKPSKETPPPTPPPEVKAKEPEPTGPTLSTCTKLNNTTKNILEEYYELRDLEEVNACVKELYDSMKELNIKPDNFLPTFVHSALCSISKEAQIKPIEELLVYLFKQELIKAAHVLEGYLLIYQSIEDKAEEFPNLPKFLGALYGTLLAENVIEVSALKEMGQTVEDRNVTAKFCGAALCRFFKDSDEETILNALKEAGVSLVDVTRKLPEERLGRHFPNETVLKAVLQLPN